MRYFMLLLGASMYSIAEFGVATTGLGLITAVCIHDLIAWRARKHKEVERGPTIRNLVDSMNESKVKREKREAEAAKIEAEAEADIERHFGGRS